MTLASPRPATMQRGAEEKAAPHAPRYLDSPAYDLPADPAARARAISEIVAERRRYPGLAKMRDQRAARMAWIALVICDRHRRLEHPSLHAKTRAWIADEIRRDRQALAELCDGDREYLEAWLDYGERQARPVPTLEDVKRGAARYRRYGRAAHAQQ